jgi:multidrug efflux pump
LLLSQLLTLYTTPVVYLMMDRLRLRALHKTHDTLPATAEGVAS